MNFSQFHVVAVGVDSNFERKKKDKKGRKKNGQVLVDCVATGRE